VNTGRWVTRLDCHELDTFETENVAVASGEDIAIQVPDAMKEHLKALKNKFCTYFPDLDPHMEWVQKPFAHCDTNLSTSEEDSLTDLRSDCTLKNDIQEKSLTDFWLNVCTKFPTVENKAIIYLMSFAMTNFCEAGFSILLDLKLKKEQAQS
jgi:hypothetical protein